MSDLTEWNPGQLGRKWLNVAYGTQFESQKLDIYLPIHEVGLPNPVIVAVHGGAFKMGDKADEQLRPMLEGLKRGYAVVSVNYRLSGEAVFPAPIHDVKAAIGWIKTRGEAYKLDGSRIALWGGSAGGNLVSLAGTSAHVCDLDPDTGQDKPDYRVQAVVDWFGPTNFLTMDELFAGSGVTGIQAHNTPDSPESELMGRTITEIPEQVSRANPETYISGETPPFLIQHGTRDPIIPVRQSVLFHAKLVEAIGKDRAELDLLEGAGHGGPAFETAANVAKVLDFLDKHLKR